MAGVLTADRADPILRQILERCAGSYILIGIAYRRVVDVAARGTDIFFIVISSCYYG